MQYMRKRQFTVIILGLTLCCSELNSSVSQVSSEKDTEKKNSFCDWLHEKHFTLPALSLFWLCPLFLSQLKRETVSVLTETVLKKLVEIEQVSVLSFIKVCERHGGEGDYSVLRWADSNNKNDSFSFTAYDLDQNKIRNVTTISPESVMNWR